MNKSVDLIDYVARCKGPQQTLQ